MYGTWRRFIGVDVLHSPEYVDCNAAATRIAVSESCGPRPHPRRCGIVLAAVGERKPDQPTVSQLPLLQHTTLVVSCLLSLCLLSGVCVCVFVSVRLAVWL